MRPNDMTLEDRLPADFSTDQYKHVPCCAVVAIAALTGHTMKDVFARARMGFGKRANWKGGLKFNEIKALMRKLNRNRSAAFKVSRRPTLTRWARTEALEDVTYFVITTHHAQLVRNGYVLAQCGVVPMGAYWGRRKQVRWACALK